MSIRKFEIRTDHFEFHFGKYKGSIPTISDEEIFDWYQRSCCDPVTVEEYDTLEEAKEAFKESYSDYGHTRAEKGNAFWFLVGDLAWIEENIFTDDGDFDQGGWTYDFSAVGYEKEE